MIDDEDFDVPAMIWRIGRRRRDALSATVVGRPMKTCRCMLLWPAYGVSTPLGLELRCDNCGGKRT